MCDGDAPGGQAWYTAVIHNFFGFPEGHGRPEPSRTAGRQEERLGPALMLVRGDRLAKTMSAYLIRRIEQHPLIVVHLETQLTELHPNGDKIAAVTFADASGKADTRAVDAVFLCIGGSPHTDWCSREHVVT